MRRWLVAMRLLFTLALDLFRSSILLAWDVLSPRDYSRVRILSYPMRARTDLEIMLLSSAISLTPGTLTLDVSDDRSVLYIHAMYAFDPEGLCRRIRDRVETPLLHILRGRAP